MTLLERYHQLTPTPFAGRTLYLKPGVRGYPELPPAARLFEGRFRFADGPLTDASGTAGAVALLAHSAGLQVAVSEPSRAALRCAQRSLAEAASPLDGAPGPTRWAHSAAIGTARAGLPWQFEPETAAQMALVPPADRGTARVAAEIEAAAHALMPGGKLLLALHKDQGAKRYGKLADALFESVDILTRSGGWRLYRARGPLGAAKGVEDGEPAAAGMPDEGWPWQRFEAAGLPLHSLPGVHAAGRLDPGTALLVETVPWTELAGRRVVDLGCGSGVLALLASRAGAQVVAVDDDLAAVESCRRNARELALEVDVRHSDVDSALEGERFDVVLTNPPFHVGRGVRLEVPRAFIAASQRLLSSGGELWLVANRDLPYEQMFEGWRGHRRVAENRGFKVLRAVTGSPSP